MIIIKEYGSRFKVWCGLQGRIEPPSAVVTALDADMDTGVLLLKQNENPQLFRNWISFISGVGRKV